ncbi:hypothetical protein D3C77_278370 [compost metagenome]
MDVLGQEVQLQVAADLGARAAVADPVQDDLLGGVECGHDPTVLLGQLQAPGLDVQLADRFEQRGLELEVAPQLAKQPRQALLHRLVGEQRLPQHRQQSVPGGAGHQQQRLVPEIGDFATTLVDADHGVDRENQRGRGDRAIAFTQCAEHGQGKTGQGQGADENDRIREQQLHRQRRDGKAHQGHGQGIEASLPTVVGLGQGAGDNAQEQRNQQAHLVLVPAQQHAAGEGDQNTDGIAEFVQGPEAAQRLAERGG